MGAPRLNRNRGGLHFFDDGVSEFGGAGLAADVAGKFFAMAVDALEGVTDLVGGFVLAEVAQHEQAGADDGSGVGDVLAGDVGRGPVDGFKNGAVVAEVGAGHQAEAAHKSGAKIGDDVAVEIFEQQHVVLIGVHDQLHAGVVDDVLAVRDLGIFLGDVAGAAQEEAIGKLHDVGLVDGVNLLALVLAGVFEGETGNAGRSFLGDDLEALNHAGHDFMLNAGVKALGIFANDNEVHVGIAGGNVGKVANGAEVGEQLESLAQFHVNAGKSAPDGGGDRAFQADAVAFDG